MLTIVFSVIFHTAETKVVCTVILRQKALQVHKSVENEMGCVVGG